MTRRLRLLTMLAALAAPSLAAAGGKVLFVIGRVDLVRGEATFPAMRGMPVEAGDRLELGPTGRTQLRMSDGAIIALQPNTSFAVEEYRLPEIAAPAAAAAPLAAAAPVNPAPDADASRTDGGRVLLSLLRGGFRTITGLIGKKDQDSYQLRTPVATIGVRGTTYSATYCTDNCGSARSGLYVGVSSGEIVVTNDAGSESYGDNEFGLIPGSDTEQERLDEPPMEALDQPIDVPDDADAKDDETPDADASEFGDGKPPQDSTDGILLTTQPIEQKREKVPGADGEIPPTRFVAYATGPQPGAAQFSGVSLNEGDTAATNAAGALVGFDGLRPGPADARYAIGTAQNRNLGFDPVTELRWGRWSAGVANVGAGTLNLANQSLHWIAGPQTLQQPALPIEGSAIYQLVGNTNPTDNAGHIGVLGAASFGANFLNGTVTSSLNLNVNNQTWAATGAGNITGGAGFPAFAGAYGASQACPSCSVTIDVSGTGSGSFAGFFVGPPGGGIPPGAGLSYSLQSGGTTVSGAAAFGNPQVGQ